MKRSYSKVRFPQNLHLGRPLKKGRTDFKKSPDNPFNQVSVAYDASKEEKVEALRKVREETQQRLRDEA